MLASGGYGTVELKGNFAIKRGLISLGEVRAIRTLPDNVSPAYVSHSLARGEGSVCEGFGRKFYQGTLVMGRIPGTPICEYEGSITKSLVANFLHKLAAMHLSGVAHKDLHGNNVLVSPEGEIYFVDFGGCSFSYRQAFSEAEYVLDKMAGRKVKSYHYRCPRDLWREAPFLPKVEVPSRLSRRDKVKYLYDEVLSAC